MVIKKMGCDCESGTVDLFTDNSVLIAIILKEIEEKKLEIDYDCNPPTNGFYGFDMKFVKYLISKAYPAKTNYELRDPKSGEVLPQLNI
ncbi:MAG: hypothetical protein PHT54_00700 [Candidatus Nanoarchaeia archaeon]|nr:hypothetical protein [Candidatus Nanoarchaeia archaeon]